MSVVLDHKKEISIGVLSILYFVGVVGIGTEAFPSMISLTPINLLISFILLLWNHPEWDRESIFFLLFCFVFGLGIEIAGVQSGLIFGEYNYGPVLGWKIWGTPLMIGINWAMLAYAMGCVANQQYSTWHWAFKAFLGAVLLISLDFFIEPVAIHYDMWSWGGNRVPLQNYLAWGAISFMFLGIFHFFLPWVKNKVASYLLILQFLFFWLLGQFI